MGEVWKSIIGLETEFLFPLLIVVLFLVLIFLLLSEDWTGGTVGGEWEDVAKKLGLSFDNQRKNLDGARIKGLHRQRAIEMSLRLDVSKVFIIGQRSTYTTVVRVQLSPTLWSKSLRIQPRSSVAKFEKSMVGNLADVEREKDISIGDREFDRDFVVSGLVTDEVKESLRRPEVQAVLRRMSQEFEWCVIRLGELVVEVRELHRREKQLLELLEEIMKVAQQLEDGLVDKRS